MNKLDEHLDKIQEIYLDDPIAKVGIAAGVGTALILANLILVFMEIRDIKKTTKKSPKHSKMINEVLGTKDWQVNLVKDPAPNAFAAGGKHIFLTTALLKHLNDREITAVMLHEAYHNKKKHIWKQLAYDYPFYYLLVYALTFFPAFVTGYALFLLGYLAFKIGLAIARIPYKIIIGRKHEYQSDDYAVKYGYGKELISAFKKFEQLIQKHMSKQKCGKLCKIVEKLDKVLDEHPSFKNRIERVLKNKQTMKGLVSGNFGKIKNSIVKAIGVEGSV